MTRQEPSPVLSVLDYESINFVSHPIINLKKKKKSHSIDDTNHHANQSSQINDNRYSRYLTVCYLLVYEVRGTKWKESYNGYNSFATELVQPAVQTYIEPMMK
jgi:hypothetical protein